MSTVGSALPSPVAAAPVRRAWSRPVLLALTLVLAVLAAVQFGAVPISAADWLNGPWSDAPKTGGAHVLWQLQGDREPVWEQEKVHGEETKVFKGWKQVTPGTLTPLQYDQAVADLVGYLQWMGEPAQKSRVRVGVWVLLFLTLFTLIAWRLNAAFWKDVR